MVHKMKIVVFGAAGRTGRLLVEQALEKGYEVTGFARSPEKLGLEHERLRLVQGDALDGQAVATAIAGQDAVLSALGPSRHSPEQLMATAAQHIVAAMPAHGARRLITLTGAGVSFPQDEPKLWNRFISLMLKLISGKILEDSIQHAAIVRASDLDWTIVRVPMLFDGPATGQIRVGYVGKGVGARICRADVAAFMLQQLTSDAHRQDAPVISH